MAPPPPAPAPVLKVVHVRAGHEDAPATHDTGQFVHAISGVIEVGMAGRVLLATGTIWALPRNAPRRASSFKRSPV